MRAVEMYIPYFKSGDDLAGHLEQHKDPVKALRAWADQLEAGAKAIREIAKHFEGGRIEIQADTHMVIFDDVDDVIADKLIAKDLVQEVEWGDEDEEEEEEE